MIKYPDTPDTDTYLLEIMEDPAPLYFRLDSREETDSKTTMYFTAMTTKEAQPDD